MPKAELHAHLNGLVSPAVVRDILVSEGVVLPRGVDLDRDLIRVSPSSSLAEYLAPWELLRLIPSRRENLKRLVRSAFDTLKASNVKIAEIRSSVLYLAQLLSVSPSEALGFLIEDVSAEARVREITAGIILTVTRSEYSLIHLKALVNAYLALGRPNMVIGLDLAGNESASVPQLLGEYFKRAKHETGLKVTIHAGETGCYENVAAAVSQYGADRIGHGTAAAKSERVMDMLIENGICLEVCPISNRLTGAVGESERHPIVKFAERGVPFVICSDNPGLHLSSLNDDYRVAVEEGLGDRDIVDQYCIAKRYSFLRFS
ncbi:adenosine deaminase [Cupriavidus oxalaticus]|uniref:adenosine deaminase n=1 Tax=Cupriavidus oxalaticus TaxID=96344 RepID=UPI00403335CB